MNVQTVSTPPGPRSWFPGHNLLAFQRSPVAFLSDAARDHGDVVRLNLGGPETYLLNHPDLIHEVLVTQHRKFIKSPVLRRTKAVLGDGLLTSEGELHLRQRRLIQPAFHRQAVARYADLMADCTQSMLDRWQDGQEIDLSAEMNRLTMRIVGQALFAADLEREAAEIGRAIRVLLAGFGRLTLPFFERIQNLPLPGSRELAEAGQFLDDTIRAMIAERRADPQAAQRHDLLSLLMAARDEGEAGDGLGMSDQQVRDEALTLFLAGHETTANALTWTLSLISGHAWVEDRLHDEVAQVLNGRVPTAEDVERLVYTRQVLAEGMRLYPPAWVIGRQAVEPFQAGPYRLESGAVVLLSPWVMQRDPRYYPLPERFDPERFSPAASAARPRYAYFPFGGGPRTCIGEPFAWLEGVLILAMITQRWQMRRAPDYKFGLLPQITLRPKYGMPMVLFQRPG